MKHPKKHSERYHAGLNVKTFCVEDFCILLYAIQSNKIKKALDVDTNTYYKIDHAKQILYN